MCCHDVHLCVCAQETISPGALASQVLLAYLPTATFILQYSFPHVANHVPSAAQLLAELQRVFGIATSALQSEHAHMLPAPNSAAPASEGK